MLRPAPRRQPSQRGVTLVETLFVLAFIAMVLAGALALGSEWVASTRDLSQGANIAAQHDSLRHATRSWYTARYCRLHRDASRRPPPVITLDVDDLRAYLPNGRLVGERRYAASRWRIDVTRRQATAGNEDAGPESPPQIRLVWAPSAGEPSAALARHTEAACESDANRAGAEACRDFSNGSDRLYWRAPLAAPGEQAARTRRLWEWQQFNSINCDTDGDDVLDRRCDGDDDGLFGPYDHDGDGGDDTARFDADDDGLLDLDVTGLDGSRDLAVTVHDWHALGC